MIFHRCLKQDFGIGAPPYCSAFTESSCRRRRTARYGRTGNHYPCHERNGRERDHLLRSLCCGRFYGFGQLLLRFDGILAMYHDQGLAPFKALAMEDGVNYTAGLPVVRTSSGSMEQPMTSPVKDWPAKTLSVRLFM